MSSFFLGNSAYLRFPASVAAVLTLGAGQLDNEVADVVPIAPSFPGRTFSVSTLVVLFLVFSASAVAHVAVSYGVVLDVVLDVAPSTVVLVNVAFVIVSYDVAPFTVPINVVLLLCPVISRLSPRLSPPCLHCYDLFQYFPFSRRRLSLFLRLLLQSFSVSLFHIFVIGCLVATPL